MSTSSCPSAHCPHLVATAGDVLNAAEEHYNGYHQGDLDAGAMQG